MKINCKFIKVEKYEQASFVVSKTEEKSFSQVQKLSEAIKEAFPDAYNPIWVKEDSAYLKINCGDHGNLEPGAGYELEITPKTRNKITDNSKYLFLDLTKFKKTTDAFDPQESVFEF